MSDKRMFIGPNGETYRPTLKAPSECDYEQDILTLRNAVKGFGTDEEAIIDLLSSRSLPQRIEIRNKYKAAFGQDLIERMDKELSGDFRRLVKMLLTERSKVNARALYKAMKGAGTDEEVIIEILAVATNDEIRELKAAYQKVLDDEGIKDASRDLESDLEKELSGHFKRFVIALMQANRDEIAYEDLLKISKQGLKSVVDMELVQKDVEDLYDAGEARLGTDEATFIRILTQRSVWHIKAVAVKYEQHSGKPLLDAIKSETSGDFYKVLKLTVLTCLNRIKAYSEILKKSMVGLGTNDATLMRVIATRCEIDLGDIAEQFQADQGKSLASWVHSETSGDYRKLLMALLGENWKS